MTTLAEDLARPLIDPLPHAIRAEHRLVEVPACRLRARAADVASGELIGIAIRGPVDGLREVVVMAAFSAATGALIQQPSA